MFKKIAYMLLLSSISCSAFAIELTAKGKILSTQGHIAPNCRTVRHQENISGIITIFRMIDVAADDDISSIALSALMANRDVVIAFDSAVTSGCGTEPKIQFITVY